MHKPFYASGFLYSLKTHQILLLKPQQTDSTNFLWSTLGGESNEGEEAQNAFQRVINESLSLKLKEKDIYPVYDYFHNERDTVNYVFYAEVKSSNAFDSLKGEVFSWVAFSEISKLPFFPHSKQDVIVGERVISAKWREDEAKKLAPFLATII